MTSEELVTSVTFCTAPYAISLNFHQQRCQNLKLTWIWKVYATLSIHAFCLPGSGNDALSWLRRYRWSVSILVLHIHADNITGWLQHYPRLFSTIMHLIWVNNISCDFTGFMNRMKFHKLPVHCTPIKVIRVLVVTMYKNISDFSTANG